jgi:hypothetical protein
VHVQRSTGSSGLQLKEHALHPTKAPKENATMTTVALPSSDVATIVWLAVSEATLPQAMQFLQAAALKHCHFLQRHSLWRCLDFQCSAWELGNLRLDGSNRLVQHISRHSLGQQKTV